jgi:hypothetical protein
MLQVEEKFLNWKHHKKHPELRNKTIYKKSIVLATNVFKGQPDVELHLPKEFLPEGTQRQDKKLQGLLIHYNSLG